MAVGTKKRYTPPKELIDLFDNENAAKTAGIAAPGRSGQGGVAPARSEPGNKMERVGYGFDSSLKTVILWIFNVNQNGTSNTFREEFSKYFAIGQHGDATVRDLTPEMLKEFADALTTSKEIRLPDLGIRLLLLVCNCNQNGASNSAEVFTSAGA